MKKNRLLTFLMLISLFVITGCSNNFKNMGFNEDMTNKKYEIEVSEGVIYTFYLLEDGDNTNLTKGVTGTAGPGEVALIMDKNYTDDNIPITMSWCNKSGSNPTSNVCNHDGLDQYIDYLQKKWVNVTVSLPTYDQIYNAGSLPTYNNVYNIDDKRITSAWLYNNLSSTVPYGYWTSTTRIGTTSFAWEVNNDGVHYSDVSIDRFYGIRPVITISKSKI